MGMDYVATRPRTNQEGHVSFHLNWAGHTYVRRLLRELEADLSEWSGSNDGLRIKANTAKDWGRRIKAALAADLIRDAYFPSKGGREPWPYLVRAGESRKSLIARLSANAKADLLVRLYQLGTLPSSLEPLDDGGMEFLTKVAEFFLNCGGCRQY